MRLQSLEDAPTGELIKRAFDDARELVRIEVGLAKVEVRTELRAASRAAIAGGVALVSALLFLSTSVLALVLALGAHAWVALAVALLFLLAAAGAAFAAYRLLPKKPLGEARRRIEGDIRELKEHMA